jgi:hypothetical protein
VFVDHVDQLRQGFWGGSACKCGTHKALDFSPLQFGTRRSVVQIHSPRPIFLESATYNFRNSRKSAMSAWYETKRSCLRFVGHERSLSFELITLR